MIRPIILFFLMLPQAWGAGRINQEGRILGAEMAVTHPILFNTPDADAVLSTMQIFPVTSPWNEDISKRPLLSNSDAMIARIIADLADNRRTPRVFFEMNFALVPDNQPPVPIEFFNYPEESDPGPYPIPSSLPVETWPRETGDLTLRDWQLDVNEDGGDRHSIIVQPGTGILWETWLTQMTPDGQWHASNGAKFDLKSNTQRPTGWTSADAAGLPMFPALIRFDECERGMVEHAVRLVVRRSRREFIYPASHFASSIPASETNVPAMGQRLRLKYTFQIPDGWTKHEKAVLRGLKKYGALVADNGNFFSISATPDDRWPPDAFSRLSSLSITNFEVIQTTGPNAGPRSPGAPSAHAGTDTLVPVGVATPLQGFVAFTGTRPTTRWSQYSGPGTVTFADAAQTNTFATFSAAGVYTLMLGAEDGIHAPAYDAVHVTATADFRITVTRRDQGVNLTWTGSAPSFIVEQSPRLSPALWTPILTTTVHSASVAITNQASYFRVRKP